MAKTLRDLARQMEKLERKLPRAVNQIAKEVAQAVISEIVVAMPVDTSKAVSNWQLGYDEANFTDLPPHVPGRLGDTRGPSSAETLMLANLFIRGKRPGVELHISNGVEYIVDINEPGGSSMPGFREKGLEAGRATLALSILDVY